MYTKQTKIGSTLFNLLLSLTCFVALFFIASAVQAKEPPLISQKPSKSQKAPSKPEMVSKSVLIVDMKTNKVIYANNANQVVPIASITKLMTAMVVLDAKQSLTQIIPVKIDQTEELKGVFSRVKVGSEISRKDMLLLSLMSSENRAAASLAHNYPGGYNAFIKAMNNKAKSLGMKNTRFVEPTGLSEKNVSTASDLSRLVIATKKYPMLSKLSTTPEKTAKFTHPSYTLEFRNTNYLVRNNDWKIALTKTGYTDKAGHCLTMRTTIANREIALVTLDAYGKYTHFADASRLRKWMESNRVQTASATNKTDKSEQVKKLRKG